MKLEYIDFDFGDARKNSDVPPQTINTNIEILNAQVADNTLLVSFEYTAAYVPDKSYIRFAGKARFSGKEIKSAYDEWSKNKRITSENGEYIINSINYSASVNSVLMAKVFNLVPAVFLPTIKIEAAAEKKANSKK